MAIDVDSIIPGHFYITMTGQIRKVTKITTDEKGRKRVHYVAKGSKIRDMPFEKPYSYHPPLEETFAKACSHEISWDDTMRY